MEALGKYSNVSFHDYHTIICYTNDTSVISNRIRNFLTLFLSIEVTKAMLEASNAKENGDSPGYVFAQRKVQLFTEQLNESNPLLTAISDAMTKAGIARDKIATSCQEEKKDDTVGEKWRLEMEKQAFAKARANEKLMECNLKYQQMMKQLRESQSQIV